MKLGIGLVGAWALGAAVMFACSGSGTTAQQSGTASTDLATMVAALSVNSDGSDAAWSEATDPEPAHVPACGFEHIVSKVIAHYDTNGDGSLSADERGQLDGDFGDHDGDDQGDDMRADAGSAEASGGADAGPALKGHPGGHGRVATLISLYDTNNDGTLDATELAALKADVEARCQARLDKLLAEFDVNGDGKLDDTEWKAVEVALHARFEENLAAVVAKFDANGDGKLSLDEAKAARAAAEQERADAEAQFSSKGDGKLDDDGDRQRFRDHGRECMRDDKPMMGDGKDGAGSGGTGGGAGTNGGPGGHVSIGVHDGSAGAGGSAGETDSSH